jgi:hypothetical protein
MTLRLCVVLMALVVIATGSLIPYFKPMETQINGFGSAGACKLGCIGDRYAPIGT